MTIFTESTVLSFDSHMKSHHLPFHEAVFSKQAITGAVKADYVALGMLLVLETGKLQLDQWKYYLCAMLYKLAYVLQNEMKKISFVLEISYIWKDYSSHLCY